MPRRLEECSIATYRNHPFRVLRAFQSQSSFPVKAACPWLFVCQHASKKIETMLKTQRLLFMSCKYSQGLAATPECLCLIQDPKVPERLGARSDVIDEALHGSFQIELLEAFSVSVKRTPVGTVVSVLWGSMSLQKRMRLQVFDFTRSCSRCFAQAYWRIKPLG